MLSTSNPCYRQSQIYNYYACPYAFNLSRKFSIKTTPAMEFGLLFEGYLFGFKDNVDQAGIEKGKLKKTIEKIKSHADFLRPYFISGESHVRNQYDDIDYSISGEFDYIGEAIVNGQNIRGIFDIKYTADINKIWESKEYKNDFLQAYVYPYIHLKLTGELLPFVYFVCENKYDQLLYKTYEFHMKISDMEWIERYIKMIHDDPINHPNINSCLNQGDYKNERCKYMEFCEFGRSLLSGNKIMNTEDLYHGVLL